MYNNNGYQQQGGYQQDSRPSLANEYYSEGQGQGQTPQQYGENQPQSYNQAPPQYQQHNSQYGQHDSYNSAPPNESYQYQQHNSQYSQQPHHHDSYNSGPPSEPYGQRDPAYGPGAPQNPDTQESSRGFLGAAAGAAIGGYGAYKLAGPATGHSKTSGLVGALGGALTGHVVQDGAAHWKDRHDEKKAHKDDEKRKEKEQHHRLGGHFAGGFTQSSRDIGLYDAHGEYELRAQCCRVDGSWAGSVLSLNRVLENDNGSFRWCEGGSSSGGGSSAIEVQPGDTLRAIAARHGCDFHALARHNGIQNEDMIYPGQRLEVPGGGSSGGGGSSNFSASARDVRLVEDGQVLEGELRRGGDWVTSRIVLDERIGNNDGCLVLV